MKTFGPTCDIFWTNFRSTSIASPTHGEEAYVPHTAGHMKNMKHPSNTWIFSMFFFPANLFERSQYDSLRPIHVSGNRWWWQSCRILRLITKKLLEILFGPEVAIRIGPKLDRNKKPKSALPPPKKWQQHMQTWVFFFEVVESLFSLGSPFWKKSMERSIPALTNLTIFQRLGRFW